MVTQPGEKFDRLKTLLREMFQLDRGDLDFGLYRVMSLKAKEIEDFLDNDLLPQVKTTLAGIASEERAALERELEGAKVAARNLGVDPETAPRVTELNQQLAEARADAEAETDVYNHLVNFFSRYYDGGDFMSLRRYSGGGQSTYLIPYDGEEVKLHWANADQYYIKTTENYSSYVFKVGDGRRVRFEVENADNERDNIKEASGKQRRFILARGENTIAVKGDDLIIRFEHRPLTDGEKNKYPGKRQQEQVNEAAREQILKVLQPDWVAPLATLAPTENSSDRTVLDKHLSAYTAKNSFDYFIHKDLGGFLHRELDLYLKNEVLSLDDLALGNTAQLRRALARMRAVRHVAEKIIIFLAQLENFQKQLWLKKKFVLETHWCVTLDRVPEMLYPEIIANTAQHKEWTRLFALDEIASDLGNGDTGYTGPLNVDFLKSNPFLVLDTRHFSQDFTDRLLAALSDAGSLDEQSNGLLVHGENFQALVLLQARYKEQVQCIYIDPPYNTGSDGFIYKDCYQHSSWISMFVNRTEIARKLQASSGVFFFSIDEIEAARAWLCMGETYGAENFASEVIWEKKKKPSFLHRNIGKLTDFILAFNRNAVASPSYSIETTTEGKLTPLNNAGNPLSILTFPAESVKFGCKDGVYRAQDMSKGAIVTRLLDDVVVHSGFNKDTFRIEGEWRYSQSKLDEILASGDEMYISKVPFRPNHIKQGKEIKKMKNILSPIHYEMETNEDASQQIINLFNNDIFENPKPEKLIRYLIKSVTHSWTDSYALDYFAGSGTTGHAVINLNREDEGHRKFLLVEMGKHFDTVLLPRMKKVVYSPSWKGGKPVSRKGSTQFFKYVRLESYEDTLDSLELTPPAGDLLADSKLAEDYQLRYALGVETASSPCLLGKNFVNPFAYTLSVVREGARSEVPVDLPETFNYLIGLRVKSRRRVEGVLAITGTDAEGRRCLILWRDLEKVDNTTLDAWFGRNRAQLPESLDLIYTNGDHTLNAVRPHDETWTAETIEPLFRELMFEERVQ